MADSIHDMEDRRMFVPELLSPMFCFLKLSFCIFYKYR